MTVARRWLLRVPDLDEIRSGAFSLTVPLVDDVIQIGLGGRYRTGTIEVCKSPSALLVSRTDGHPLQAQILRDDARVTVLRAPVPELRLRRVRTGLWRTAGAVPVGQVADLERLIRTIANFGLAKQDGPALAAV
ncbi:hypothetical protein ACXPWS_30975 [Mycobacterium sp. BMJ-28]